LRQSHALDEVVVCDDASGDGTRQMLDELAEGEPRLRIFSQAANTGGVANWNLAVRQTRGGYIAWCSDDDRFLGGHLEKSCEYLDRHPDVGLVHAGFVDELETRAGTVSRPRRRRFAQPAWIDREGLITYMIRYYDWPFHPSTLVVRREVWEQVGEF